MSIVIGFDCTRANIPHLPPGTHQLAGYSTGRVRNLDKLPCADYSGAMAKGQEKPKKENKPKKTSNKI